MIYRFSHYLFAMSVLGFAGSSARGAIDLHGLFTDNMVLQQGAKVPVWGTAPEGARVTVSLQGQSRSTRAKNGKWRVNLKDLEPGGPFTMTVRGAGSTIELKNVMVGGSVGLQRPVEHAVVIAPLGERRGGSGQGQSPGNPIVQSPAACGGQAIGGG